MNQFPKIKYVIYSDFVDDLNNCRNIKLYEAAPELLRAAIAFHAWFKEFDQNVYAEINCVELRDLLSAIAAAEFQGPSAPSIDATPNPKAD